MMVVIMMNGLLWIEAVAVICFEMLLWAKELKETRQYSAMS
jgi:hypothetical protein